MKKKILAIILTGITILSTVGCSKVENNNEEEAKAVISTEIKDNVEIQFWHSMKGENEEALKK